MYKILQDDDSHYYIVPEELKAEFESVLDDWELFEDFINDNNIREMNYHLSCYRFPEVIEPEERTQNV